MQTIKSLKKLGRTPPYQVPLKVAVVAAAPTHCYKKQGEDKTVTEIGVADMEDTIKVVCYDKKKLQYFIPGSSVMIRNFIFRENTIIVTATSKVSTTPSIGKITSEAAETAKLLVIKPVSPVKPIAEAKSTPLGEMVSIVGKITKEEETIYRTLKNGEQVPVKQVTVKDNSGEARVSLWRNLAELPTTVGSFFKMTDVKPNFFKGELSFNSGGKTIVEETEAVPERYTMTIDGYYEEGEDLVLVCKTQDEMYKDYICPTDLLPTIVDGPDYIGTLSAMLPMEVTITSSNDAKNTITNIQFV